MAAFVSHTKMSFIYSQNKDVECLDGMKWWKAS